MNKVNVKLYALKNSWSDAQKLDLLVQKYSAEYSAECFGFLPNASASAECQNSTFGRPLL